MLDENALAIASIRLNNARECLDSAKVNVSAGFFKAAANRSYYCIFHAMRAVEALDIFDSKKHSGVISYFHKNYIHTNVFSVELSDILKKAFVVRNDSDYDDHYVISKNDVIVQVENAKKFLTAVEEYLKEKGVEVNNQ